MLITYCSNDTDAKYGSNLFSVEAGRLPHESLDEALALYTHVVQLEVEPDNIWGCPNALVIDASTEPKTVRPKEEAEFLADAKPGRLDQLQSAKSLARDAGFMVGTVRFDSDTTARLAYMELAMSIQQNPAYSTQWKASEGTWLTMDAAMFQQVYVAGAQHMAACFAWQSAKIAEVAAATTMAELDSISLTYV